MKSSAQRKTAIPKILFVIVLAAIAIAIAYAALRQRDWSWPVPEEAKQLKNPVQPSARALEAARGVYLDKCAQCHGDTGKGDGRDAARHDPRPADFTDIDRMRGITDGELFYKISEGKKPMPVFKTRLTEEQRWELVLLIHSFIAPRAPESSNKNAPAASGKP